VILISPASLLTRVIHATDYKKLSKKVNIQVKLSDTSCCRRKLRIICRPNSVAICVYLTKIYIWAYSMVTFHSNKCCERWRKLTTKFQKVSAAAYWPLGSKGKLFFALQIKNLDHSIIQHHQTESMKHSNLKLKYLSNVKIKQNVIYKKTV
jgi:hypothetical protein